MEKRYYIAYGSNLNVRQMKMRCPSARIIGTSEIPDYELLFKGSRTGSYLTIEPCENGTVPVVIWEVTPSDEKALDRYEGYPTFYYKKDFKIKYKGILTDRKRTVTAFAYIMHEDRPHGAPSGYYVAACLEGYRNFGFDAEILLKAVKNSRRLAYEKR